MIKLLDLKDNRKTAPQIKPEQKKNKHLAPLKLVKYCKIVFPSYKYCSSNFMTLCWNNRSQFSWTSISEGCSLKVKRSAHGRGVWEQQLYKRPSFFKSRNVFISSKLVARTRGALRGTADEDENWWTRKKFAKVTVEQHWQFKTRTIGELIGRFFFFFKSRTLSFNWDNTKGLLAPLHSVMLKIYPTMTSTFPTFSFLFSNNQTLLLP